MSDPGVRISGGGSIAVDTEPMLLAMHCLAVAGTTLRSAAARAAGCLPGVAATARTPLGDAVDLLRAAAARAGDAGDGLRTSAWRYGLAESEATALQQQAAADAGTVLGYGLRALGPVGGAVLLSDVLEGAALLGVVRAVEEYVQNGRVAPQADPVLIRAIALTLASLDDAARAALLGVPGDGGHDDPAAPFGSESIAALLSALLLHPAGGPLTVAPTGSRTTTAPGSLAALADRIPDGAEPGGQVRIERYDGPGGTRWIVYIAGTVTFARDSGTEPFDLASNLNGVAHRPSDSERAVLDAMRQAGVGPDEPVLLVGHSQGALNAVRVAQDGGYRVGGVVQFGGPTGQIALPADVPVLSVEHDEDLVPALGGTAAAGAAGLNRLVVRRSLPRGGFGVPTAAATADFPAHDLGAYRRTLAEAEATDDVRLTAFERRLSPFLDAGAGTATRYHAERSATPPPNRPRSTPAK